MSTRRISKHWPVGGLFSVGLLVACLVGIGRAQSDTPSGSECESLRTETSDLSQIVVNSSILKAIDSDVQLLLNCMPPHGLVRFSGSGLPLEDVLKIKKPVTIQGNGMKVQCLNDERKGAFKIRSNNVTISGIVFEGCNLNSTIGLVDVKNSKNVRLEDVQFIENENSAGPGCISVLRSEMKLLNVEARNNSGLSGGVLHAKLDSHIKMMNSFFGNNEAKAKGGAVYLENSEGSITDVAFEDNKALHGGAAFVEGLLGSVVIVENATFSGNKVEGENNQSQNDGVGGAVALVGPNLKAEIKGAIFARNLAGSGGGFWSANGSTISIFDSFFIENSAMGGSAIFAVALTPDIVQLEVRGTTFESNSPARMRNGISPSRGAMFLLGNGTSTTLVNVTFSNNSAQLGGAISGVQSRSIKISRCTFNRNEAGNGEQESGQNGTPRNIAVGGAFYGTDVADIFTEKSTFTKNHAIAGGAMSILARGNKISNISIVGCNFDGNSAIGDPSSFGGALNLLRGGLQASIKTSNFTNNKSGSGGAVAAKSVFRLEISSSRFFENKVVKSKSILDIREPENGQYEVENENKFYLGGALLANDVPEISVEKSFFVGNQAQSTGGAIHIFGSRPSDVSVVQCTFNGNSAVGDPRGTFGGAMHLYGSGLQLSVKSSNFTKNEAPSGGAINGGNVGRVEISHSTFFENKAVESSSENSVGSGKGNETRDKSGGALFLQGVSETSIFNSSFMHNKAVDGGGIIFQGVDSDGSAETSSKNSSGGFVLVPSLLLINGTSFKGNAAKNGGAVALEFANVAIEKSSFTGNVGDILGGAMYSVITDRASVQGDFWVKTSDVEFKHNSAAQAGGALFLVAVNLEMEGGLCRNNSAGSNGGAIHLIQLQGLVPNATITSGSFIENQAELGGGIFLQTGNLNVSHCEFQNNIAQNGGGALYCEDPGLNLVLGHRDSVITVHFSTFSRNKAGKPSPKIGDFEVTSTNGKGGAVLMTGLGLVLDFRKCNFSDNAAGSGGAGHIQDVQKMTLEDSNFQMGSALTGGALTVINAGFSFEVKNVSFLQNVARWGGAISLSQSVGVRFDVLLEGPVSLTEARFVENAATRGGGAVDLEGRSLECTSCLFDSNSAGVNGGALRGVSTSNITLVNSIVNNCTATHSGGGISLEDAVFRGENATVTNNAANENGGAFAVHFGTFAGKQVDPWRCKSCRIHENKATAGGGIHISMDDELTSQDCGALEAISSGKSQHQRFELLEDCDAGLDAPDSLRPWALLESTSFEGNFAKDSGSHIFLGNFNSTICCDDHCWNMRNGASEALQKCGLSETPTADKKTTSLLGTSFQSVVLSPSLVTGHASGTELPAMMVTALDSLDQLAVANVNLKIGTTAPGVELFGSPITREGVLMSGDITVTGVFMRALPGSYSLSFELTSGDRVVNKSLSVEIRECVIGEIPQEGGLRCDKCAEDFFSFDVTDEKCTPCPVEKARCSGGTLVPLDGFWHSGPLTSQVHACLSEEACTYPNRTAILFASSLNSSGDYPQCAKGYRDVLCGSCDGSHGKSRLKCAECQGEMPAGFGIVVVMLALAVLSLIYVRGAANYSRELLGPQSNTVSSGSQGGFNLQGLVLGEIVDGREQAAHQNVCQNAMQSNTRSNIFKILVNFFQVTGSAAAINVGWTQSMLAIFTTWDVVSGVADSNSFFSLECAFSSGRNGVPRLIQTSVFLAIVPFMVWAALVVVHYGSAFKSQKSFHDIKLWSSIALLAVVQASYISVTRTLVRIFNCVDVSPMEGLFWAEDTSVDCYKGSHAFLVGFVGAPGLLLISIGFPGWLLFILTRGVESLEKEKMVVRYGFLYHAYKKNVAAWEVVILLRKASLAAIVVFGRTLGEAVQGNLALFIMMGSIVLQMQFHPFSETRLNILELGSLVISTLAFIIGNLIDQPRMNDGGKVVMSIVFIIAALMYVMYMLKQIFDVAFLELREWMEKKNLGGPLPTNNFRLLIAAAKRQIKKMKEIFKEKKVAFTRRFS